MKVSWRVTWSVIGPVREPISPYLADANDVCGCVCLCVCVCVCVSARVCVCGGVVTLPVSSVWWCATQEKEGPSDPKEAGNCAPCLGFQWTKRECAVRVNVVRYFPSVRKGRLVATLCAVYYRCASCVC